MNIKFIKHLVIIIITFFSGSVSCDLLKVSQDGGLYSETRFKAELPNIQLQRDDGEWISLVEELNFNKNIILSFSFLSCRAVCPMILHNIDVVTKEFKDGESIQSLTITLDPKNDTPQKLSSSLKSFNAGPVWRMYTGTNEDIVMLQKTFQVYRGDKMNHLNAYLIHRPRENEWILINGSYITPGDLVNVIKK